MTTPTVNTLGQPVGGPVVVGSPTGPVAGAISGRHCNLVPLDVDAHGADLFAAYSAAEDDRDWTYLPYGPFRTEGDFTSWLQTMQGLADPMFFTVVVSGAGAQTARAAGLASFLRVDRHAATIEVGHIHFSPAMQRTVAATEAMYLMMRAAFDWGYRRYEWKCDDLNAPSRSAAERLGFTYEGTFRQATHYKGRNRDTAWYAITDTDWPVIGNAFERWLEPTNFDAGGRQKAALATGT